VVHRDRQGAHDLAIVPENVYNVDETGILLNVLSSLKGLVSKQDLRSQELPGFAVRNLEQLGPGILALITFVGPMAVAMRTRNPSQRNVQK
jgi:hypothetical protein